MYIKSGRAREREAERESEEGSEGGGCGFSDKGGGRELMRSRRW